MAVTREFTAAVRKARMEFLKSIYPVRPELYRYCRALTRNVWDAEDLIQDVLLKSFAKLADVHWDVENPRAYLFRMASNLWIDRTRRPAESPMPENYEAESKDAGAENSPEVREAITRLAVTLPPVERAAMLLKDVFGFSLNDTANYLETTTGAVKSALHRGRGKLKQASPPSAWQAGAGPDPKLVDQWCEAFNARDLDRLAGLMLEDAEADVVGMVQEYGRQQIKDGSLHHTVFDEAGEPKAERTEYRGEPVVILWYTLEDGSRAVRDVLRFRDDRGGMASLKYYYFCPETLKEVLSELGLPLKDNGYRYA